MWNEEKQQELLKAQELVQQLERAKEEHRENYIINLAEKLDEIDVDYVMTYLEWESVAGVLIDNRDFVIKLLEDIK